MELHHDMRKPHYFIFFLLVLLGKLSFAGSTVHSLFHQKDQAHVAHHSEVANYFPVAVLDQPVEMEDDSLEKSKKHYPSLCDVTCSELSVGLPAVSAINLLKHPAACELPADLVILHCRILI